MQESKKNSTKEEMKKMAQINLEKLIELNE